MSEDTHMESMEFEISFTDVTMLEGNGEFNDVSLIMQKPQKQAGGIVVQIPDKEWIIKSTVTIQHDFGFSMAACDFYYDGRIMILEYAPSIKDLYTPDIRCLTAWAHKFGWKVPEPSPSVIRNWKEFWKIQWETYIVDSPYFKEKFGDRQTAYTADYPDDDNDEIYLDE